MGASGLEPALVAPAGGVERLLAAARAEIDRLAPAAALAATAAGAVLIDIRPSEQRRREGELPGAHVVERNVLEWRLDPRCRHRDPDLARPGRQVILICREGYQSSLAAATLRRFGVDAADVTGGTVSWRAAGLPVRRRGGEGIEPSKRWAAPPCWL